MTEPAFDASGFYDFDLESGSVRARGGERVLVLSDNVLGPLVSAAVQAGDLTPVRTLGYQVGDLVAEGLGGEVDDKSPEAVLGHAAGALSVFGWGKLGLARYGDALVATMQDAPTLDPEHLAVAALLGGMFSSLADEEVACVPVDASTFVVVDPTIAAQVWGWAKEGAGVGAIVDRLAVESE